MAKRKATAEAGSGIMSGSVGPGREPSGHYWDKLTAAGTDKAELRKLAAELKTHGYSETGQLRSAVAKALGEG